MWTLCLQKRGRKEVSFQTCMLVTHVTTALWIVIVAKVIFRFLLIALERDFWTRNLYTINDLFWKSRNSQPRITLLPLARTLASLTLQHIVELAVRILFLLPLCCTAVWSQHCAQLSFPNFFPPPLCTLDDFSVFSFSGSFCFPIWQFYLETVVNFYVWCWISSGKVKYT